MLLSAAVQMSMHVPQPLAVPASVWWGPPVPVLMRQETQIHPIHALVKQGAFGTLHPESVTVRRALGHWQYRLLHVSERVICCKSQNSRRSKHMQPCVQRHLSALVDADIDACKETPCLSDTAGDVTCVDELPPALGVASGRTCTCGTGYVYVEGKGCTGESVLQLSLSDG
jgi:hypothetical protein